MTVTSPEILMARKAVAETHRNGDLKDNIAIQKFADMIERGSYDTHMEMQIALSAIELALADRIAIQNKPENFQTMVTIGQGVTTVVVSKNGGLTWLPVSEDEIKANS